MSNSTPKSSPLTLTLIVATTPTLGIGLNGTLPWPLIKPDMSYFARVTKRTPPSAPFAKNVVVMGRKTWDSIPPKFRPLKGRTNIVVTRSEGWESGVEGKDGGDEVVKAGSLGAAVRMLRERKESGSTDGKVFVIGGASIYKEALKMEETRRILLTRIEREYEVDTFFPVDLDGEQGVKGGWEKKAAKELDRYTGEEVGDGKGVWEDIGYEFCLYER